MALKQDFAEQLQGQIAVWQGQIKDYQERLGQAGAQAKADYEKSIASAPRQRGAGDQAAWSGTRGQRECLEGHAGSVGEGAGSAAAGLGRGAQALSVGFGRVTA